MMNTHCFSYTLDFTFLAGTSRGVMTHRDTHFIVLEHEGRMGIGECAPLPGLSLDDRSDFTQQLNQVAQKVISRPVPERFDEVALAVEEIVPAEFPALRFGLETAWLDLFHGGSRSIFSETMHPEFTPIPINGLVWMGDPDTMLQRIDEKIRAGFRCIKLKIGAVDFSEELRLLSHVRQHYDYQVITLRVDANGAFSPEEALGKLEQLARFDIHSIEQPIRPGQPQAMAGLCRESPVPIALDEELIGKLTHHDKQALLDTIQPQYIILKPTLVGGLNASDEWISLAQARNIGWWATSALESNIGLNAVAQWVAQYAPSLPQGLGTGQLYHNNIASPIVIDQGYLAYDQTVAWDLTLFRS